MVIKHSANAKTLKDISERIKLILPAISEDYLRHIIETISIPRHYDAEKANNERTARWIHHQFEALGYQVSFQGRFQNILALPVTPLAPSNMLVGAHYDTVPGSPGADDNGSGIAVLLACARALSQYKLPGSTIFMTFNREEDNLLGSQDFVRESLQDLNTELREVHVMEMVGYCSHEPGSQHLPQGLPVKLPDRGDFLGLIGNQRSTELVDSTVKTAKTYLDGFPVLGLSVYLGLEKYFPNLQRSDHAPFWHAKIPALMWTDTAEFRNANYHSPRDTPDTLDYSFMRRVAQLLLCKILLNEANG
ncbi:MAG: M28 family peptidase [bacterium]|nr:M28 family peptidase [bacterium]